MAFFSQGGGRNKLMLLYFINEVNAEITRDQLFTVFAEQNWMDFFDFQTSLAELEESGLVASVPFPIGQCCRITQQGLQIIELFSKELPFSIREKLSLFAGQNRDLLRHATQFSTTQTRMPDGSSLAVLRLMDNAAHILDVTLHLPNAGLAKQASERWPEHAEAIYQHLLGRLFSD